MAGMNSGCDEAPALRGRDAIVAALTEHFAEHPKKTFIRELESVRFKSKLSAVEEDSLDAKSSNRCSASCDRQP